MLHLVLVLLVLAGSSIDRTRPKGSDSLLRQSGIHYQLPIHIFGKRHSAAFHLYASSLGTDDSELSPPEYDGFAKAVVVFDDDYFYIDKQFAKMYREIRAKVLGDMTVNDVYNKYTADYPEGGRSGLQSFANAIGAIEERVLKYFDAVVLSIEEILHKKKFIDFTGGSDFDIFQKRRLANENEIPISKEIYFATMDKVNSQGETRRESPLGLVLGSSGSGKTFFSLQSLAHQFLTEKNATKVALYFHAGQIPVTLTTEEGVNREGAAEEVAQWIKEKIARRVKQEIHGVLNMHLCVILDEAGSPKTKSWFEDAKMLVALCSEVKRLATSVAVVVSGTGLTGRMFSSTNDAYVFRMRPWAARDVRMLLDKQDGYLGLQKEKGETTTTVANAIFANPKLGALATNARAAYFMVETIAELSPSCTRDSWTLQLYDWTPVIFANVVARYIASNGIKRLNLSQRRLVAASVFRALDEMKPKDNQLPMFVGLQDDEITCAESLVQYNVDLDSGTKLPKLVDGEEFAMTITPAIAVVLYAMAGVGTSIMNGWKADQELAALYAVRQLMLQYMEKYVSDEQHDNISKDKLKEHLGDIRLVALDKQVKTTNKTFDTPILMPIVGKDTVLINAGKALFADVIAPYMLLQAKQQTSKYKTPINLHVELEKCGLLRNDDCDTRLLQGLVAVWRGNLQSERNGLANKRRDDDDVSQPTLNLKPRRSRAFPENLLYLVPEVDYVEYAVIEGNDLIVGDEKRPLPSLNGTNITFILSTNLDKVELQLSARRGHVIGITDENLDGDLEIKVDTLSQSDQLEWTRFVEDEIRAGIRVKFLLTRSA